MKFAMICAAALASLSIAACSSSSNTSSGTASAPTSMATAMATAMARAGGAMMSMMKGGVTMNAQNGSGESGSAKLTAKGSQTLVVIKLKGEKAGASQPAHIHPGSCAKLNPVPKYPLSPVVGGVSSTLVAAPIATLTNGHYAINVHASAANLKLYVSCGDIK